MGEVIKAYKGFDKSLRCRGFQFEVGKEFEESAADVCKRGFHACEMPLEVLKYYEPGNGSRSAQQRSTGCKNDAAGERNIGVAWGPNSFCKGSVGSYLVLSEWGDWDGEKYPFIGASMLVVDGENIKPDTWYALKNGHVVEVSDPDKEV